ncbi:hypothetical protein NDN01_20980 [Sphingomonas sp. QA11]|uniref:hypothetical protein n=1 Tax=Sphingomonas sp. QA11 TaxID=2950605 RepID=UPI0023494623|nr:hypothetical protein [Sphingomonas sp. QA11]WCM26450.1 hypothetical protein NDN01_20980 [Sphingomonas sp. QA11]
MDRKTLNRLGLAAAILLVPGGFILGATLAAQRYRKQHAEGEAVTEEDEAAEGDTRPAA